MEGRKKGGKDGGREERNLGEEGRKEIGRKKKISVTTGEFDELCILDNKFYKMHILDNKFVSV